MTFIAASCGSGTASTNSRPAVTPTRLQTALFGCERSPASSGSVVIPNVMGYRGPDAEKLLACGGFEVAAVGLVDNSLRPIPPEVLVVVSQDPKPGKHVRADTTVELSLAAPTS